MVSLKSWYKRSERVEILKTFDRLRFQGHKIGAACRLVGISTKTLREWKRRQEFEILFSSVNHSRPILNEITKIESLCSFPNPFSNLIGADR